MKFFKPFRLSLFFGVAMIVSKADAASSPPTSPPPLETVLQRVLQTCAVENSEYHRFNQHYFYTRDKVTEFYDGSGKLRERKERQTTNNPAKPFVR